MSLVGIILIVIALASLGFGIFKHLHAKKILAAPFARTSSVPGATLGPKGAISTEGVAEARELLIAPCSGTPCLYYELVAYQKWEEVEQTEDGEKKKTGRDKHEEQKLGMAFSLNDGSGPVTVDGREGISGKLEKTFSDSRAMTAGHVTFGAYSTSIDQLPGSKYSKGIEVEEHVLKPSPTMFVMGKWNGQAIVKADGLLGNLFISGKGREALLGATTKQAKFGMAGGGAGLVVGIILFALGGPIGGKDSCDNLSDVTKKACSVKLTDKDWKEYEWTVTQKSDFAIVAKSPAGKKIESFPEIEIFAAGSNEPLVSSAIGEIDEQSFAPGKYKIRIKDEFAKSVKGGLSVDLNITSSTLPAAGTTTAKPVEGGGSASINGTPLADATAQDIIDAYSMSEDFEVTSQKETPAGPMKLLMIQLVRKNITGPKTLNSVSITLIRPTDASSPVPQATLQANYDAMANSEGGAGKLVDGMVFTVNTSLSKEAAQEIIDDVLDLE
ncbi:MAG: hypothetical protein IPL79_03330 [Myxococcales bacterium]|nr:hypothetical protein [Myxococcales bacterium]